MKSQFNLNARKFVTFQVFTRNSFQITFRWSRSLNSFALQKKKEKPDESSSGVHIAFWIFLAENFSFDINYLEIRFDVISFAICETKNDGKM